MAQQAPFGTDEQLSRDLRIIGSKQHEVSAQSGYKNQNMMARTPFKHSDRPPWYLDADRTEQRGRNKLLLQSIETSPRNNFNIPQRKDNEEMQSILSRLLADYPSSIFRNIRTDLLRHDLRGLIPRSYVELCFKKFNVPLPPAVMTSVLHQFTPASHQDMINYELLISYLFPFSANNEKYQSRKTSNAMKLDSSHKILPSVGVSGSQNCISLTSSSLVKKAMDDRDKAYLLVQTEQAFKKKGSGIIEDIKQLHEDLKNLSNGNMYVMLDQIQRRCSSLAFPLNETLLRKILERFNVKDDNKINWRQFLDFIEKAVPMSLRSPSSSRSSIAGNKLPFWETQTPLTSPGRSIPEKDDARTSYSYQGDKWGTAVSDRVNFERSYEILKVDRKKIGTSGTPKTSDVA